MESELFGHEKGAFTGAVERRAGCFELAQRGSLLLDEICEMPVATQAKLLRVLEDSRVRRLGGKSEIQVDTRVIVATNRLPDEAVEKGLLREDLYYRMNVFQIVLPPLRERLDDLPQLVEALLSELNRKNGSLALPVGPKVNEAEKALILSTLEHTNNNKTRAAEILGISLKTLFNKLKEYGSAENRE
jgi:transcriptional regulator with PAS, ATPase and Fis domain